MKCPKCGFNSFEFLDNCKKCGSDLVHFKKNHGIDPIVYTAPVATEPTLRTPVDNFSTPPLSATSSSPTPQPLPEKEIGTWSSSPAEEAATREDEGFAGFEFDFLTDDGKQPEEPESFEFAEEPPAEASVEDSEPDASPADFSDFSFYEETIDPANMAVAADKAGKNGVFGTTGVIGEILPEQLTVSNGEQEHDESATTYSKEFVFEDFEAPGQVSAGEIGEQEFRLEELQEPEEISLEELQEPEELPLEELQEPEELFLEELQEPEELSMDGLEEPELVSAETADPEELVIEELEESEPEQFPELTDFTGRIDSPQVGQAEGEENEFVFEDFPDPAEGEPVQAEPQPERKESKQDPLEGIDFDREFESLFTDDSTGSR